MICTMYVSIALDMFFLTGSKISNSKFLGHSFFIKNRRPQFELLHNITESTEADAHALTFQFDSKQLTQRSADFHSRDSLENFSEEFSESQMKLCLKGEIFLRVLKSLL